MPGRARAAANSQGPGSLQGALAGRAPSGRPAARPVREEAREIFRALLPSRSRRRLDGRQADPRHRALHCDLAAGKMDRLLFRHPCGGAGLVLARHGDVAAPEPPGRGDADTGDRRAGSRRRGDRQGDVHASGGGLRRCLLGAPAARQGHRPDGARQQGVPRRLVLGLVRLCRMGARLAAGREEPVAQHGLRPVLHQLPRLREGQSDIRLAQEHQGRAR